MRAILAALIFCLFAGHAQAYWISDLQTRHAAHQFDVHHHLAQGDIRHAQKFMPWAWSGLSSRVHINGRSSIMLHTTDVLSAACRIAASLGGPCGCFASEYFFGRSVRELWRADAWLSFPHVAAAAGTAMVIPGRHVAPVLKNNGDGTVTIHDSWADHLASIAGKVFVDPHGGRYALARRRYARADF
jgi:hypothetical protein